MLIRPAVLTKTKKSTLLRHERVWGQ